jgi:hypothetical protein
MDEPTRDGQEGEEALVCPHCAQPVGEVPGDAARVVACPHCGGQVVIPARDGALEQPEEAAQPATAPGDDFQIVDDTREVAVTPRSDELDGDHIRQMVAMRRSAMRSRSYAQIGAIGCGVSALQLIWYVIKWWWYGQARWMPLAAGLGALLCLKGVWACLRAADRYRQEAEKWKLPEPQTPPDLSALGDNTPRPNPLGDDKNHA